MTRKTPKDEPPKGRGVRPRVVELKTDPLSADHRAHLEAGGLTEETIRKQALRTERDNRKIKKLLSLRTSHDFGDAIVIPYLDPSGHEVWHRVRPSRPRTFTKPGGRSYLAKYESPYKSVSRVFVPELSRESGRIGDPSKTLVLVEGEKKAMYLAQLQDLHDCAVAGAPGVSNFHSKPKRDAEGVKVFADEFLAECPIEGRTVVILFDADLHRNDDVRRELRSVAGMVLAAGGKPLWVTPPPDGDEKGVDDFGVAHGPASVVELLKLAKPVLDPIDPADADPPVRLVPGLKDAPIDESLRWPFGYTHSALGGLWRDGGEGRDAVQVAARVPLIRRILIDMFSKEERVELVFRRQGRWQTLVVERRSIASSKAIVEALSDFGGNVRSSNAMDLVDFLSAFEELNEERLPRVECTSRCGWHVRQGERHFVAPGLIETTAIAFDGRFERDKHLEGIGVAKNAKLEEHVAVLREVWDASPIGAAAIASSLAAPVLRPLGQPSFALHLIGESSKGKSIMMEAAASVYGDPTSASFVPSWHATLVSQELRAATLCDLPFFSDEVGNSDPKQREAAVYMLVNGMGKTRGSRSGGMQETRKWRTVVISTGERAIVDETAATGASVRVLQPFVYGVGNLGAEELESIRARLPRLHGALGRAWLKAWLGASMDDVDSARAWVGDLTREFRQQAPEGSLAGRQAMYYATLALVESQLADEFGLGDPEGGTIRRFAAMMHEDLDTRIRPAHERALEVLRDWVLSKREHFPGLKPTGLENDVPEATRPQVVYGYQSDREFFFLPGPLRARLKEEGLESRTVFNGWAATGLCASSGRRHTVTKRIHGHVTRVVRLEKDAIFEEDG